MWDHACNPTQLNMPHLYPSQIGWHLIYHTCTKGWKAELTLVLVIYLDGLRVRRQ